ncbi:MAG: MMPL family transporter [Proteobacteria bacterium]|nr:MMPL family transporter [Pseudomonadota bacterium]
MEALAQALAKRSFSLVLVIVCLTITIGLAICAVQVEQDDDLLAFLPDTNPDIAFFRQINDRFGGLDVAIVGIEAPELFSADFLGRLKEATDEANTLEQVSYAVSIVNVDDITPDPEMGGIKWAPLVEALPNNEFESDFLREKVMSRDHIVGQMVSADGSAVILYCFLGVESDPRATAEAVRGAVRKHFPDDNVYWGGAPFISTYIYDAAKKDMDRLTPWSVVVIVLILLVTFRDPVGAALALSTTGMGIATSLGTMKLLGIEYNIVLSSMPVILFAVGSAYAIHVLAHYYRHAESMPPEEALHRTIVGVGPPVLAAGLTTVAGLLSFVAMDIEPMRIFGAFTALGIFTTLVLSLTFVPAMIRLTGLRRRTSKRAPRVMAEVSVVFATHRAPTVVVMALVALLAGFFVTRVTARMDNAAFFDKGSKPDLSERFLSERFGGSQFIQILAEGDMKDPAVLLDVQHAADQLSLVEHVSSTIHIVGPLTMANEAMEGLLHVPDSREKAALLLGLMTGNKAIEQLVDADRTEALVQLKLDASDADAMASILNDVQGYFAAREGYKDAADVIEARIAALARQFELEVDPNDLAEAVRGPLGGADATPEVTAGLLAFMGTDEFLAELPDEPDIEARLAAAVAALGPDVDADGLVTAASETLGVEPTESVVDDIVFSLEAATSELWIQAGGLAAAKDLVQLAGLQLGDDERGARILHYIAGAMTDLGRDTPSPVPPVRYTVSGLPMLYRGLEASVTANQWRSLALALLLVFIVLSVVFKSPTAGLLAASPTFLTLLLLYGAMGALGVSLDIGTSMLASLVIGAGVDYAVHMVAAWRAPADGPLSEGARAAAEATASAIWTNAIMVAAGFFVLTLGEARPLQNVGLLTASAMMVAGATTFIAIPALARKRSYSSDAVLSALHDHGDST